jgi:hypothetical protein
VAKVGFITRIMVFNYKMLIFKLLDLGYSVFGIQ